MGSEDQSRDKTGPAEGPGRTPDGAAAVSGDDSKNHKESSLPRGSDGPGGLHEKAPEEKMSEEIFGPPGTRKVSQFGNSRPGAARGTGQEEEREPGGPVPAEKEEITELEWMRRQMRDGTMEQPVPHLRRPSTRWKIAEKHLKKQPVQQKPGPKKPEQAVFRKTELHTRPPLANGGEVTGITRRDLPGAEEIADLFRSGSPEWIRLLLKRQDDVADDLYRQAAKAEEYLGTLDERLGQVTGRLDRRVSDLEERGRYR